MRILGIDPGFAITGYSIIDYQGNKFKLIDSGAVTTKAGTSFPLRLTKIYDDLTSAKRMNRLLLGDVGSGKTLCAEASAYIACKNGYQCALMCPTEILAFQHFEDLYPLFERVGISCELLTGSTPAKQKAENTMKQVKASMKIDY